MSTTTLTPPATAREYATRQRAEWRVIDRGDWHNVPGQLNAAVLDRDSYCTGYGRHARLVGPFRGVGEDAGTITLREDLCATPELPLSDDTDRARVLNGWGRMHAAGTRLVHVSSEHYTGNGGECIEHTYRVTR